MTNPRYKFRAAELVTHLGHRVYQIKCIIKYILISFNLSMNHQFWTGQSKFCVRAWASYSELEIYYLLTCISFTDEDANWFVINKPAGLTVHPCGLWFVLLNIAGAYPGFIFGGDKCKKITIITFFPFKFFFLNSYFLEIFNKILPPLSTRLPATNLKMWEIYHKMWKMWDFKQKTFISTNISEKNRLFLKFRIHFNLL